MSTSPKPNPSSKSWSENINPGFQVPSDESESDEELPHQTRSDTLMLVSGMNTPSSSSMNHLGCDIDEAITPSSSTSHIPSGKLFSGKVILDVSAPSESTAKQVNQLLVVSTVTKSDVEVFDLTGNDENKTYKTMTEHISVGSSQANPIDLEPADPKVRYDTVSDSDDEGPECFPISQNPTAQNAETPATQVTSVVNQSTNLHCFMNDSSEASQASEDEINNERITKAAADSTVADSDVNDTDPEDDLFVSEGEDYDLDLDKELIANHGFTSRDSLPPNWDDSDIDEEEEDDDQGLVIDFRESSDNQKAIRRAHVHFDIKEDASLQPPRVMVEDSQMMMPPPRINVGEIIDVSQNCMNPWVPLHRAPSPSDAALVKPPRTTRLLQEGTWDRSVSRPFVEEHVPARHPSSDINSYPPKPTDVTSNHAPANPSLFVPDYHFNYNDQTMPRYEDGPFAGWQKYNVPSLNQHQHQFMLSSRQTNLESQQNDLNMSDGPYTQPYWRYNTEQRDTVDAVAPPIVPTPYIYTEYLKPQKLSGTREVKSSRLPISDIVNEASVQINDLSRGLKRKVDEMTTDEHVDEMTTDEQVEERHFEMSLSNSSKVTQESILPDAQPREVMDVPESMRHETHLEPMSPIVVSVPAANTEGPARKKLKTDVRRPSAVRTFVSGMVAGGLSVMGALFVYGVTAPEIIQDTVRLEFQQRV